MMVCMSTMTNPGRVPQFTLGWRLRLALESADMSVQYMAEALGYSRSTISRWLNDQDEPRAAVMAQWALLTGVDRKWLDTGLSTTPPPDRPTGEPDALGKLAAAKRSRQRFDTPGGVTEGYLVSAA